MDTTAALPDSDDAPPCAPLALGTRVGRYVLLQRLGEGGMGVVYAGHDPDLDRRVAIKFLRGAFGESERWERVLREGKAMARVSHPHVVQVFDVGSHEGNVFIAMELVEGLTLDRWLRETRPSVRRIVDVFVEAGAALDAAHRAGLDRLGQGRVLTPSGPDEAEAPAVEREKTHLAGTPAFMAPEQLAGTSNELTDQFNFFVSLYQSLFGELPYPPVRGNYFTQRRFAKAPQPGRGKAPSRLVQVVLRGLRVNPDERYPSIKAAVEELAAAPGLVRRRALAAAACVAIVGTLGGTYAMAAARTPCPTPMPLWETAWNEASGKNLAARFATTGRPYARAIGERVGQALDARGRLWVSQRSDACEATRVRGDQSPELLDRRMACLDRRLDETRALVHVLTTEVDPALVDNAVQAVDALPSLEPCADRVTLLASYPPPSTVAARQALDALRPRIEHAAALERAGRYHAARLELDAVDPQVTALDHAPLSAEVLFLRGTVEQHLGELVPAQGLLERAAKAAALAKDDEALATTWIQLMWLVGYEQERHVEALALRPVVEAQLARLGERKAIEGRYLHTAGQVLYRQGKLDEAQSTEERALALRDRLGSDSTRDSVLLTLGDIASERGDFARARGYYERALVEVAQQLGSDHPATASARINLGNVARDQHRYDEALSFYEDARRVLAGSLGDDSPELAAVENNTAAVLVSQNRWADAVPHYESALHLWSKFGADHPRLGYPLVGLGACYTSLGRTADALKVEERAIELWNRKLGPDHPRLSDAYKELGNTYLAAGDSARAEPALEKALSIATAASLDPSSLAEIHFLRAKVARARRDRVVAERAARSALSSYEKAEGSTVDERHAVEQWLATLPP